MHRPRIRHLLALAAALLVLAGPVRAQDHPVAIVMHGGAGTILRKNMTPEMEARYRGKMKEALQAGHAVLENGGRATDAVVAAISVLEDSPLFNSGKGAVFTADGHNELDAAIMDGSTLNAGAVAAVEHIAHPIRLARLVMDSSKHVLLVGSGAEEFALEQGMRLVPHSYFFTQHRWDQLQEALRGEHERGALGDTAGTRGSGGSGGGPRVTARPSVETGIGPSRAPRAEDASHFGTVGCAALDRYGHLAAGTSTGGLTAKRYGRVGDSPIVGAGTYANDSTLAASGTGIGEDYMRMVLTKEVSDLMAYRGWSLGRAADYEVNQKLVRLYGKNTGGLIALDRDGNIAMPFNTPGMYRGYIDTSGKLVVKIYGEGQ
ncbi:MAG TPA: isoaspartyl peptidase/L-asparaginase [Gemmatimonadota bacterium]|nr:isoaspartyl peptidase/L-asparaginase [Gemmatimonadota bacterium]